MLITMSSLPGGQERRATCASGAQTLLLGQGEVRLRLPASVGRLLARTVCLQLCRPPDRGKKEQTAKKRTRREDVKQTLENPLHYLNFSSLCHIG